MKQIITLKASSLVGHTARFGRRKKIWIIHDVVREFLDEDMSKPIEMRILILTSSKGRSAHEKQTRTIPIICGENEIRTVTPNSFRLFYDGKRSLLICLNDRCGEEISLTE